jgi:cation diffusion facilitator CzcD-associated flavoprotein CzcO
MKVTSYLISFNRSPTWITPEFGEDMAPSGKGREAFYPNEEKERMRDPEYLLKYRKWVEDAMNATFYLFRKDSAEQKQAVEAFTVMMKERLNHDERLCKLIIPNFGVGCRRYPLSSCLRRFTPGHGYLEALVADNAEVVTSEIDEISEGGLLTRDGKHHKVDIIVCATGFNTSFKPNFVLIGTTLSVFCLIKGRHGTNLQDVWKDEAKSYLSLAVSGFPNYFSISSDIVSNRSDIWTECTVSEWPCDSSIGARSGLCLHRCPKTSTRRYCVLRSKTRSHRRIH